MKDILPYVASVICSIIAGLLSYIGSRKQATEDIKRLEKQHELDIEKERELFKMEKEKMEIGYKHQLELLKNESANQMYNALISKVADEIVKNPNMKQQISQNINSKKNKFK